MSSATPHDILHGTSLAQIVTYLVEELGWEELGERITIRCFTDNPSVGSSLKFLRRTPWARAKVERLYVRTQQKQARAKSTD